MSDSPTTLDAVTVLAALANINRWQMVAQMARGEMLTLNGLVETTKRSYKSVHKDMDVLYASGAVAVKFGEDKRVGWFYVPEQYRRQPGVVDYGCCAVRFGDAAKVAEKFSIAKD